MPVPPFVKQLRERIGHDLLLLPGVAGVVVNDAGEVLLQRRSDLHIWAPIGGVLEPGEDPADAIAREILEEAGVVAEPLWVSGVYATHVVTYPNGDRSQFVTTCFRCRHVSGEPRVCDDE